MKFKSSRLREFGFEVWQDFAEAKSNGEIIALAENQIIRSINSIKGKKVNKRNLERWFTLRDKLRKRPNSVANVGKIARIQDKIVQILYVPEYVTIVMEHTAHYEHLFRNGLMLNGKKYVRFSCSASQGRVSTVVFCDAEIADKLQNVMDNGRNVEKELTPSKYNAYLGLAGSATRVVSAPRFCVVADYESAKEVEVNFVTETDWEEDDAIEKSVIRQDFNRFDGQGLISYEKASQWAEELGLDYVPAQWCIRQNYTKGMLCTFPIHQFCAEVNGGNYNVKSIYGDVVDLSAVDVILTESMVKLWDSFDSAEVYADNCVQNNLDWGVSLYTPKETKDILKMNYQFVQTLRWGAEDVAEVCGKFVDWVAGVNSEDIWYTLLFLIGKNNSESKILEFLNNSNFYWVKSLIVNHDLLGDKFIRKKIYDLIKTRIKRACLGEIITDGNFQVLVSDPYALMQWVCGQEVTGILQAGEYYSAYWSGKGVQVVNSMRSPLTYRSEHLKLNLVCNAECEKWYRYCYEGIIVNVHGSETLNWAGSDFDYDQIATTSDVTVLKGVYEDELPVAYDVPKAIKKKFTDEDLYEADLFSFGSIIGSITNKSTSGYALLPLLEENSAEYDTIIRRLKMCTKLQSAQIDKAKIGSMVKGIPKKWTQYEKDGENNSTLLGRHPYFFIYLYKDTASKYKKHIKGYNDSCMQKFDMTIDELIAKKRKKKSEREFLDAYHRFMPVIKSNSVSNLLCKHIESIDFEIKKKIKVANAEDIYKLYMNSRVGKNSDTYNLVLSAYREFNKTINNRGNMLSHSAATKQRYSEDSYVAVNSKYEIFKDTMGNICSNAQELVNYLVEIFYVEYKGSNKDLLWNTYGKHIYQNVLQNSAKTIMFPFPDAGGDIEYLNSRFSLREVRIGGL